MTFALAVLAIPAVGALVPSVLIALDRRSGPVHDRPAHGRRHAPPPVPPLAARTRAAP